MGLQIEDWAAKNLRSNANELMADAVKCYNVGVYRPAFLSSYLAFKITIRERVLKAAKPDAINEKCWEEKIIDPLDNDDRWEGTLNTIVNASKQDGTGMGAVFKFTNSDSVKNRYEYWKNIRNSCAHAKDEHITSSTVEQFWNYMQDDLPEFYVLGGKVYLVDRLTYAYKYFFTVGEDELKHILKDIESVYKKNTIQCFEEFYKKDHTCLVLNDSNLEFWTIVMHTDSESIRDALVDFLYQHIESFMNWYENFPEIFLWMTSRHPEFISDWLMPHLVNRCYVEEHTFWRLLTEVLRNAADLVDLDKITRIYDYFTIIDKVELDQADLDVLHKHKVFQKFLYHAGHPYFDNSADAHWKYYAYDSNMKDEFPEKCFEYVEWDIKLVEKINSAYLKLEHNDAGRTKNTDSKCYAERRRESYDKIIAEYSEQITQTINDDKKELDEYKGIKSSLDKQISK